MNKSNLTPPGIKIDQPEPGMRYAGKLIRDMTDSEVETHIESAKRELNQAQLAMQSAVMEHAARMAIANVLAFEHERRTKKIRIASVLQS